MIKVKKVLLSGAEVWPIIEGGKGIGISNGETAGAFAAADAIGTISGVCPPDRDEFGNAIQLQYKGSTRKARSQETIQFAVEGSIREIKRAYEISDGKGRIHLNILWGIAEAETIIENILNKTQGMIHGITCGAGMPYRLAQIAEKYNIYYYPIISSFRAFSALWNRAYKEVPSKLLGGVVYEDPWVAGGHNGLSNKENPDEPQSAYDRVADIRKTLNKEGLNDTPVIMAGGVWNLSMFDNWLDNPEIGPIAFQLGTRPLLTKESPISEQWKQRLLTIKKGDIELNRFSSTGFYSSALNNDFLEELKDRASRQVSIKKEPDQEYNYSIKKSNEQQVYTDESGYKKALIWIKEGFTKIMETPDSTLLFVTREKGNEIQKDQRDCKGCLAGCKFSSWSTDKLRNFTTGLLPDPRSFCIFKTLQNAICGHDIENELIFSGHNGYLFSLDPLYMNGHIPSVRELVNKLIQGE